MYSLKKAEPKLLDYSFDQINTMIKENRKRFTGLSEEASLNLERQDKSQLVENEYRKM
jgi:hypothetical protein